MSFVVTLHTHRGCQLLWSFTKILMIICTNGVALHVQCTRILLLLDAICSDIESPQPHVGALMIKGLCSSA